MGDWNNKNMIKSHDNENAVRKVLEMTDNMIKQFLMDCAKFEGFNISELDPEMVLMLNRYIGAYNNMKELAIEEAKKADDKEFGDTLYKRRIEEKIDRLLSRKQ